MLVFELNNVEAVCGRLHQHICSFDEEFDVFLGGAFFRPQVLRKHVLQCRAGGKHKLERSLMAQARPGCKSNIWTHIAIHCHSNLLSRVRRRPIQDLFTLVLAEHLATPCLRNVGVVLNAGFPRVSCKQVPSLDVAIGLLLEIKLHLVTNRVRFRIYVTNFVPGHKLFKVQLVEGFAGVGLNYRRFIH